MGGRLARGWWVVVAVACTACGGGAGGSSGTQPPTPTTNEQAPSGVTASRTGTRSVGSRQVASSTRLLIRWSLAGDAANHFRIAATDTVAAGVDLAALRMRLLTDGIHAPEASALANAREQGTRTVALRANARRAMHHPC